MRKSRLRGCGVWVALAVITIFAFTGCDNLLGEDDEKDQDDEVDPVELVEDGTLTMSVSGVPMDIESTTAGDESLFFAAFVFEAGTDVLADSWAESWVGMVGEEIIAGSASGPAFQIVDGAKGAQWVGTAGESYDVYGTVYCVTLQDGPPLKDGKHFTESNPEFVHGTIDWQTSVTYQQDGDHTISVDFSELLGTVEVEFVAQGALGLVGLVMDSLPEGGPPEELGPVTLDPEITGITVEMTSNNSDETTTDAELVITIDGYEYPETGLDPVPTASGEITLSVVATGQADLQVGFVTSNLVLSLGGDSVAVEMDGTASDFDEEAGATTFTGTFTCDGAEHDLAILVEMYNIP